MSDCTLTHEQLAAFWQAHHQAIQELVDHDDIWYCLECGRARTGLWDGENVNEDGEAYCDECIETWRYICPACYCVTDDTGAEGLCPNCDTPLVERRKEGEG